MQKRSLVWLGLFLVLALIAAACGGDDDDGDASTDTESTPAEESAEDTQEGATDEGADSSDASEDETGGDADAAGPMEPQVGGEMLYGLVSDGTGFNTTDTIHPGSIRIIGSMNDSLVGVDADNNWTPNLAEALTPNDDFTEWTITLRPDVRFHDGAPVNADAIIANFEAFKAGPNVGFALAPIVELSAVDDLTVLAKMNTSWASFPFHLVGQPGWMVSPETIGSNDTFVGVGPFKLESWTVGDSARVVRNDDYWRADEGLPYLDAITFKVIPEQEGRRQALEAGDIDAYTTPGDPAILDFRDDPDVLLHQGVAAANEALILLNTAQAPMDDVRVRQAMAHAIDQQLIIDTFRSGLTEPAKSFIHPQSPWYSDSAYPEFDPAAAQALVDEYEAEVGPIELTLKATNVTSTLEVAELVLSFWAEVGIDAEIEEIAPGTEVGPVVSDAYDAIMWAQFSAVDPDGQYVFFHSSGGLLNWTNLVSEKMDGGFDLARSTDDPAQRAEGYAMVQDAFAEEVPILWFDHLGGVEAAVSTPQVHGIPEGFYANGKPTIGLIAGSFFSWEDVWVEQG